MRPDLRKRRTRMVNLIALGYSLEAVVDVLSKEFDVSKSAVYADYERMNTWVHDLQADEKLCAKLKQRLEYLNRVVIEMLLDLGSSDDGQRRRLTVNEQFVKLGVVNAILKITVEQIKLGQDLGLIARKPEEIITHDMNGLGALIKFSREGEDFKDAATAQEDDEEADDEL